MTEIEKRRRKSEECKKHLNALRLYIEEFKAYGLSNEEISKELGITENFVKTLS